MWRGSPLCPTPRRVLPNLLAYLERLVESVVAQHALVRSVDHEVEKGPEYDIVTIRIRFQAATYGDASAIARGTGDRVGTSDEHWQLVGLMVERLRGEL